MCELLQVFEATFLINIAAYVVLLAWLVRLWVNLSIFLKVEKVSFTLQKHKSGVRSRLQQLYTGGFEVNRDCSGDNVHLETGHSFSFNYSFSFSVYSSLRFNRQSGGHHLETGDYTTPTPISLSSPRSIEAAVKVGEDSLKQEKLNEVNQ